MAKDVKGNTVSTPNFENTNLPEEFISKFSTHECAIEQNVNFKSGAGSTEH